MDKAARWSWSAARVLLLLLVIPLFAPGARAPQEPSSAATPAPAKPEDYIGSETCSTCHAAEAEKFQKTAMAVILSEKYPIEQRGCEACHGPGKGHAEGMMAGEVDTAIKLIFNPAKHNAKETAARCMVCHQRDETKSRFHRSRHLGGGVSCSDCHDPHLLDQPAAAKPDVALPAHFSVPARPTEREWLDNRLLRQNEPYLCYSCHREINAEFQLPVRHRVNEGMIKCTDCHNPHGRLDARELKGAGLERSCYSCHVEKRGPFVYEHASVRVEGCTACHTPHGSINLHLLKRRQQRQLCLECHVEPQAVNVPHPRLGFQTAGECTRCHIEIHGSNYQRQFLR